MSIRFKCEHCGKSIKAASGSAGKNDLCPGCGEEVEVPGKKDQSAWVKFLQRYRQGIVACAIGIAIGLLVSVFFWGPRPQQWQSSGDGRTIFNHKTGELKLTHSGELVKEAALKKINAEKVRRQREAKQQADSAHRLTLKKARQKEDAMKYLVVNVKAVRQSIQEKGDFPYSGTSLSNMRNSAYYLGEKELCEEIGEWIDQEKNRKDKIFGLLIGIFREAKYNPTELKLATKPFRIRNELTEKERMKLIDVLADVSFRESGDDLIQYENAIKLLKEYEPGSWSWGHFLTRPSWYDPANTQ